MGRGGRAIADSCAAVATRSRDGLSVPDELRVVGARSTRPGGLDMIGGMPTPPERLAVLIDADNTSPRYVRALLDELASYGTASVKRA